MKTQNLLNIDSNAKTIKGNSLGYKTAVLYLSPHRQVYAIFKKDKRSFMQALENRYGVELKQWLVEERLKRSNLCNFAKTCKVDCLNTAGHGKFDATQFWRAVKTAFYLCSREKFMTSLEHEINLFCKREEKKGFIPVFRFNGTSDQNEAGFLYDITNKNSKLCIYDYTKDYWKFQDNRLLNYSLTYSIQDPESFKRWQSFNGHQNCAVVTSKGMGDPILKSDIFKGFDLIDGDKTDLRFLDPQCKGIVVLKAKGKAKKSKSKFIVNNWTKQELTA